jgi:hypothetical protein
VSTWSADDMAAFPTSSSLRSLTLVDFRPLSNERLVTLLKACPRLEELRMEMMPHVSLTLLPAIGRACRELCSLQLLDVSSSLFKTAPLEAKTASSAASSSSLAEPVFPSLRHLTVTAWEPKATSPPYSALVLESLVMLLSSSPVHSVRLNLAFNSLHELNVFSPLTQLEELKIEGTIQVPDEFVQRRAVSRAEVKRQLTPHLSNMDGGGCKELCETVVFHEEQKVKCKDGQWRSGRDAFFFTTATIARRQRQRVCRH